MTVSSTNSQAQFPATVYLARHATPDWSRTDIPYDLPPGPPLTAQGDAEARQLGAYLRSAGVIKIYGSPFARTWRTAQLAAAEVGIEPVLLPDLSEVQRGEKAEVVLARVRRAWQDAVEESCALGPVALVTHGGCVLYMLRWLGIGDAELLHYRDQFDHRNPLPPAGAWRTQSDIITPNHFADEAAQGWSLDLAFTPNAVQPFVPELAYA